MRVLIPLPARDFDPTESAVPWKVITQAGHQVVFATPDGTPGEADDRMLTGRGLGPWRWLLPAHAAAKAWYGEMSESPEFRGPVRWEDAGESDFDGLVLAGGHAQGMKPYLESAALQRLAVAFFAADKPVGAICHGVLVLARAVDPSTSKSVLNGRRGTALLRSMELSAWALTGLWLGSYYRTYPRTVQDEVCEAHGKAGTFESGPSSLARDSLERLDRGFIVQDGNYVSGRWPGDAHRFATEFVRLLGD